MCRGVVPTTQRAIILTATQFAMYDETKYLLLGSGLLQEGIAAHMCASIMAGLAVATTTNPIDLIKSRFMNQAFDPATGNHNMTCTSSTAVLKRLLLLSLCLPMTAIYSSVVHWI